MKGDLGGKRAFGSLTGLVKASHVVGVEENPESILEKGRVFCSHHSVNRLLHEEKSLAQREEKMGNLQQLKHF